MRRPAPLLVLLRGVVLSAGLLGLAACTHPTPVVAPRTATLVCVNRTPWSWSLAAATEPGARRSWTVEPRGRVTIELPPGRYEIHQTAHASPEPLQRIVTVVLAANETYDWPLATLLTDHGP